MLNNVNNVTFPVFNRLNFKMSMDYAQMVKGCRKRDAKAQRALYDAMAPMAMGVCIRYARDREEARDYMQDGFVKVFENVGKLKDCETLRTWVYKTMLNTCIDHCRIRKEVEPIDNYDVRAVETDPYTMEEIVLAMQKLPKIHRTVFNLCDIEGYKLEEVAKELKSSYNSVKVALCRARKMMGELLEGKI